MLSELTTKERIDNSIALLDRYGPADWRSRIDPSTLNMASCSYCIGGQVFAQAAEQAPGQYNTGFNVLMDMLEAVHPQAEAYWTMDDYAFGYPLEGLKEAWIEALRVS
jgi:hypothetical protein